MTNLLSLSPDELRAELKRLRELDAKATPGPWWALRDDWRVPSYSDDEKDETGTDYHVLIGEQEDRVCSCCQDECLPQENAEFIAAARNALPELITLCERKLDERDAARDLLAQVYVEAGNEAPASRRHALTPGLRDRIRDYLYLNRAGDDARLKRWAAAMTEPGDPEVTAAAFREAREYHYAHAEGGG